MLTQIKCGTNIGLLSQLITIEVDVASRGFPTFTIVGLPNKEVQESRERVRTALVNNGVTFPDTRVIVNLSPADVPKSGSHFDLGIALGIIASQKLFTRKTLSDCFFIGELSLNGEILPVTGVMPLAWLARSLGVTQVFVPAQNAREAAVVEGIEVYGASSLQDVISHLEGKALISQTEYVEPDAQPTVEVDMADVAGQEVAKRALTIAAAGMHNIHLKGVPGAGKTMLSRALAGIMPRLTKSEILDVTKIYSIAGLLNGQALVATRPFRKPHHTTSKIGLIGGGSDPTPGEISLSHNGVLFLDEFPEFERGALESLRQPMEDGVVTISRAARTLSFPTRFLLVAASNPCPCGYFGSDVRACKCSAHIILKYEKKLSGPILDRIDLHVYVQNVDYDKFRSAGVTATSSEVRVTVDRAVQAQSARYDGIASRYNGHLTSAQVKKYCLVEPGAMDFLQKAAKSLNISARSYFKIIKVAQTIADLEAAPTISTPHISEALQYRSMG